jgi:hypothetical protein
MNFIIRRRKSRELRRFSENMREQGTRLIQFAETAAAHDYELLGRRVVPPSNQGKVKGGNSRIALAVYGTRRVHLRLEDSLLDAR